MDRIKRISSSIKHIFYVYSEASLAVFAIVSAGMSLGAGLAEGGPFLVWLALPVAGLLTACALLNVLIIVRSEREYPSI